MLHVGDELSHFLADVLESASGLPARMAANTPEGRSDSPSSTVRVLRGQLPISLLERHTSCKLPVCAVYCRKVLNDLREKFTLTSGSAEIVAEGTVSSETLEGVSELNSALVLSIAQILGEMRGEWAVGGYFGGGWEVQIEPIKSGGLQYVQTSKVVIVVDIRRN